MKTSDVNSCAAAPVSHDQHIGKRVLFKNGDIPRIPQLARAEIPPQSSITPHAHRDMHEIFYVEQGEGSFHVQKNGEEQAISLRPGVCVVVEPGETHWLKSSDTCKLIVVYFGVLE